MHDPLSIAWEIKRPWPDKTALGDYKYYPAIVTVWHVDPEKDGTDDSCDWFGRKRKLSQTEKAIVAASWNLERVLDNEPFYPSHEAHRLFQPLKDAIRQLHKRRGPRIHPRWHFWHYRIQIHAVQALKRWLFSRCCICGGRFSYGYAPLTYSWSGPGPRWFRSEPKVLHQECDTVRFVQP